MKFYKPTFFFFYSLFFFPCSAQDLEDNKDKIKTGAEHIFSREETYSTCLVTQDDSLCTSQFMKGVTDAYELHGIANVLFDKDAKQSMVLHHANYNSHPKELSFVFEYAMALHREGKYEQAIPLYEACLKKTPDNFRLHVWLSECYINTGAIDKATEHWNQSNHASHHTSIDFAICMIHGYTGQLKKRSALRHNISQSKAAFELIFLDLNWEDDWWNKHPQRYFLDSDISLIKDRWGEKSKEYKQLFLYSQVKLLSEKENQADTIKALLQKNKLILGAYPLPANGAIASDLLRIALSNGLLDEQVFFKTRGAELLKMADSHKDPEFLNAYAYLESHVHGRVSETTDKKGWEKFKDERFAMSYFIGLADKNRYNNPELGQALKDFPESSAIYWIKLNCAKIEGIPMRTDLIEEIRREFKSLKSMGNRSSYPLKGYFNLLEKEK